MLRLLRDNKSAIMGFVQKVRPLPFGKFAEPRPELLITLLATSSEPVKQHTGQEDEYIPRSDSGDMILVITALMTLDYHGQDSIENSFVVLVNAPRDIF